MQAPRTSRASLIKGRSQANAVAQQALIAHWQSIVKSLNNYLKIMRANYVSIRVNNSATVIIIIIIVVIINYYFHGTQNMCLVTERSTNPKPRTFISLSF